MLKALNENDLDLMDHLLKTHTLDIYQYICFALSNHWDDADQKTVCTVGYCRYNSWIIGFIVAK